MKALSCGRKDDKIKVDFKPHGGEMGDGRWHPSSIRSYRQKKRRAPSFWRIPTSRRRFRRRQILLGTPMRWRSTLQSSPDIKKRSSAACASWRRRLSSSHRSWRSCSRSRRRAAPWPSRSRRSACAPLRRSIRNMLWRLMSTQLPRSRRSATCALPPPAL